MHRPTWIWVVDCPQRGFNRFQTAFKTDFTREGKISHNFRAVLLWRYSFSLKRQEFWKELFLTTHIGTGAQGNDDPSANLLRYIRSISKLPKFQSRGHFVLWPVCLLMHFPHFIDVCLSRHLASIPSLGTLLTFFGSLRVSLLLRWSGGCSLAHLRYINFIHGVELRAIFIDQLLTIIHHKWLLQWF